MGQFSPGLAAVSLGYSPPWAGASPRSQASKNADIVDARDWKVKFDAFNDDTSELQKAINGTPLGARLMLPPGVAIYSSLTIPAAIAIVGASSQGTNLRCSGASGNSIVCTTATAIELQDLVLSATGARVGGSYLQFLPLSNGVNSGSILRSVSLVAPFLGIDWAAASYWLMDDVVIAEPISVGVNIADAPTPDAGDSRMVACRMTAGNTQAAMITQASSGGLALLGCKFIGGAYHYAGNFPAGVSTTILLIEGGSSEAAAVSNIALRSSGGYFGKVLIAAHQFSVNAGASGVSVVDNGYDFLDSVKVSANEFNLTDNSTAMVINRGRRVQLSDNAINGDGVNTTGINLGANVGVVTIGVNPMNNVATPYVGPGTIAATTVFNPPRVETGQIAGTTSVAYGANFVTPAINVNFAQPYTQVPFVEFQALGGVGPLSVVLSAVSVAGFTANIIGVTVAANLTASWRASG